MSNKRQENLFYKVDWSIIIVYLCLISIGWFNIYAAVYDTNHTSIFDLSKNYGKQFIWIVTSGVLILIILLLDIKFFTFISYPLFLCTLALLVYVLFVGKIVGGNKAWINLGIASLQPSEFAKIATGLTLARYISSNHLKLSDKKAQLSCFLILAMPIGLILLQPDVGSALTYSAFIFVLYREGLPSFYLIACILMAVLFILTLLVNEWYIISGLILLTALLFAGYPQMRKKALLVLGILACSIAVVLGVDYTYENILKAHQRNRIEIFLGKKEDSKGSGYNVNQSKIAIGSGGLSGKGFLKGTQTKYDFVPEQSTDFIFCTIGEEWGFIGSVTLLFLYAFLLMRIILLAERQRSLFSRIYGYSVASIIFVHITINLGMTTGIVPVIGIPLPFLSYGGSSLWSFTILVFILLKLDQNRNNIIQ